jgi:uncharacterized protein
MAIAPSPLGSLRARTALRSLVALAVLLASCGTGSFFFRPVADYRALPDPAIFRAEEVSFASRGGARLRGWVLEPLGTEPVGTVLFLHGNYGNVSLFLHPLEVLAGAGFQALTFDYQGYGGSEGSPTQEGVLDDALAALDYLRARPDLAGVPLILYGQSLGGHLAVVVAAQRPDDIDALAIEGAFTGWRDEAAHVGARFGSPPFMTRAMVPERYRALDVIDRVRAPVLVIHSDDDQRVPAAMGAQLFERALSPKLFWKVKGPHVKASEVDPDGFAQHFRELLALARQRARSGRSSTEQGEAPRPQSGEGLRP